MFCKGMLVWSLTLLQLLQQGQHCHGQRRIGALSVEEVLEFVPAFASRRRRTQGERKDFLVSYFVTEYDIRDNSFDNQGGQSINFTNVADALMFTYNDLIDKDFDDPYSRRMDKVNVFEVDRRLLFLDAEVDTEGKKHRKLFTMTVILEVLGACIGCTIEFPFTNQLTSGSSIGGDVTTGDDTIGDTGDGTTGGTIEDGTLDGVVRRHLQNNELPSEVEVKTPIPSTLELLEAYSIYWKENRPNNDPVQDVLALTELSSPPTEAPTNRPSGSPSDTPSILPSNAPSTAPSNFPSQSPMLSSKKKMWNDKRSYHQANKDGSAKMYERRGGSDRSGKNRQRG